MGKLIINSFEEFESFIGKEIGTFNYQMQFSLCYESSKNIDRYFVS